MESSGSCLRCATPLTADSVGGLCSTCASGTRNSWPAPVDSASPTADPPTGPLPPGNETALFEPRDIGDRETASHNPAGVPTPSSPPVSPHRSDLPEAPLGYRLLRRLGSGGMGDVFLAQDLTADRLVALKYLRAHTNPTSVDRFFREVQALARADHPNIIRVLGHDYYRTTPYFTMEYAAGGTLGNWVSRHGPLAPTDAARLMAMVARAVHAAHEAGVLHRDLKPGNILLAGGEAAGTCGGENADLSHPPPHHPTASLPHDLTPKVSDFGLAKWTGDADSLTPSTGAIGTPGYIPPEQVSRRFGEIDRRADVYGLGATLYHLLTGRPPFHGPEPELHAKVVTTPPERPRVRHPGVPPGLEAVVMKCLEKRPADRFATAAELADELEKCADGEPPTTPPLTFRRRASRWAKRNRARLGGAGVSSLLAAGLVAIGLAMAPVPPTPDAKPLQDPVRTIQQELVAGGRVVLAGKTGQPRWHSWRLGAAVLDNSPAADNSCSFQANDTSLLDLLPDPGIERYRFSAELRHIAGQNDAARIGIYFSADEGFAANGSRYHPLFAVWFRDRVAKAVPHVKGNHVVRFDPLLIVQREEMLPGLHTGANGGSVPFEPVAFYPGDWRQVVVEMTPDTLLVQWRTDDDKLESFIRPGPWPRHWTGDQTRNLYAGLQLRLDTVVRQPGLQVRPWQPRLALGVMALRSTVAFRNVVIEHLPARTP